MKILVADDDSTSRLIIQTALRNLGHECHTVFDGAQAWDMYRALQPDVVISDWMMPELSGLQLCRKIREHTARNYTYFVMVTNQRGMEVTLEGMNAGVDDYLTKPLDVEDLQARLIAAERVTALHVQLAFQRNALESLNDELAAIARRDALTDSGNRRALEEDLELLEARVARYGHRYCMALLDVDHFKSYNDTYGHQAGDQVLRMVAGQLHEQIRGRDELYRYGGDEFLCIFPEQSLERGTVALERMRRGVEGLAILHAGNPPLVVTISGGLAMLDAGHHRSVAEVLKEADEALYRAKQLGRNRVEQLTSVSEPV
jgi:two-component system, cell cycle response regulator